MRKRISSALRYGEGATIHVGTNSVDLSTLRDIAMGWMTIDPRPRIIVDLDGWLIWASEGTERLLDDCRGIAILDGIVRLSAAGQDADFLSFLRRLHANVQSMALKFPGEDSFCVLRGHRVPGSDLCCIDLRFTSISHPPILVDFDRAFGLTASEARTAGALYSGQSAQQIAISRHISIETVRSHIRQVYSKIGVSGREQLFRQIDAFRID